MNPWIVIAGAIVALASVFAISCCESVRRTFPINVIFLGLLSIAEGLMLGFIGAAYGKETVRIDFPRFTISENFEEKNISIRL